MARAGDTKTLKNGAVGKYFSITKKDGSKGLGFRIVKGASKKGASKKGASKEGKGLNDMANERDAAVKARAMRRMHPIHW
jgi:hypothetical protein